MPNDLSDALHDLEHKVGHALSVWEKSFVAAVRAELGQVEPDLLALGASFASETLAAAQLVASGGATLPQALQSILPQIPSELQHLGHIAMTLLGLAVQKQINDAKAAAQPAAP